MAHLSGHHMIVNALLSQLVIIDMQVKLAPAMPKDTMQAVVKNCSILAQAANLLSVTTTLTEQYPQGLYIFNKINNYSVTFLYKNENSYYYFSYSN